MPDRYAAARVAHLRNAVYWLNEAQRHQRELLECIRAAGGLFGVLAVHLRQGMGDILEHAVDKTEDELRDALKGGPMS